MVNQIIINGVPNLFVMSKDDKKAFFQDPTLIAEILERKQEKTKKELSLNLSKGQAIVR